MFFSRAQLKYLADFSNSVAVALFAAGTISPFFQRSVSPLAMFVFPLVGATMAVGALTVGLKILEGLNYD